MMIKIEITSEEVNERKFEKDGKTFSFREQEAWLHFPGEKYPTRFKISLGSEAPFREGFYSLGASCYTVDKYGSLAFRRQLQLVSLKV